MARRIRGAGSVDFHSTLEVWLLLFHSVWRRETNEIRGFNRGRNYTAGREGRVLGLEGRCKETALVFQITIRGKRGR